MSRIGVVRLAQPRPLFLSHSTVRRLDATANPRTQYKIFVKSIALSKWVAET